MQPNQEVDHENVGRTCLSAWLLVNGTRQVPREQQHLGVTITQALEQVAGLGLATPGCSAVFGEPDPQALAPPVEQRIARFPEGSPKLPVTGLMGGGVEPVRGTQRLLGPGLVRVGLAGGDQFAADVRAAQIVPGLVIRPRPRHGVGSNR